ncbi:DUF3999 family protein [Flavobacterium macacae]|uniref:DUF3999 family protein n=1 Tax=Flavobacterium macacae TaxID=2488993 RepID=A0A3P3WHC2_9FLAO|nr:DUF3999 family protein [Flavobacterium macacae]RRJ93947.1 DUF3999 family protein [Flavobacterium macacae]
MTIKNKIFRVFLLLLSFSSFAQTEDFKFKRKIENTTETWHKIILPESDFSKLKSDFSDIRIFESKSKTEAPYILKCSAGRISQVEIPFQMINVSNKNSEYFYTFELSENKQINQIKLDFEQHNFDWKIDLEASNNQSEWFSILKNYRILAIKNNQTDYQFTQVDFPDSKYKFYRLKIKANEQPKLSGAKIWQQKNNAENLKISAIKSIKKAIDSKQKLSIIDIELVNKIPVSQLNIEVTSSFDYYRPLKIEALKDSVQTEKGWHFNYEIVSQETLSSLDKNSFSLGNSLAKKLRITIENENNQPLEINSVTVKNPIYYLLARFTKKGNYDLFYGNNKASKLSYDIENFQENIPKNITEVTLSKEEINPDFKNVTQSPLFENKIWLWALMGIIIIVIGYFSLKMLRE